MSEQQGYWQRRLSRRRVVRGASLGGAGLAVAAGFACSSTQTQKPATTNAGVPAAGTASTGAAASPAAQQPKRGGTVTDARFAVITGRPVDPGINPPTINKFYRLWYQGLLGYNWDTNAVEPELAAKWEQPSPTEFVFTIQPGVKWHDKPPASGRAMTVDDVVFGLNRARTPNQPQFINRSLLDPIAKIEAAGTTQLRLTTTGPNAVILQTLASDGLLILAPDVVDKAGKFATPETIVGTGPFILRTLEPNVGSDSVRNPDYWKAGLPYLDGFRYRQFADLQEAYSSFTAGQVDIDQVPGNQVQNYVGRLGKDNTPNWAKDRVGYSWFMPNVRNKPFNDARITRALRLLIDYNELIKAWGEAWFGRVQYGTVLPQALDGWDFTHDEYASQIFWKQPKDQAVKEALDLLSAAGFTKSAQLKFEVSVHANIRGQDQEAFATLAQAQWRQLGQGVVDTTLKFLDGAQTAQTEANGSFAYGLMADAGAMDDPDSWFSQIIRTGGSRNYGGFSDSEIDGMIDKQRTIFDLPQRKAAVKDIMKLLTDRSPTVLPGRISLLDATNPKLRGYSPDGQITNGRQFEHVWLAT